MLEGKLRQVPLAELFNTVSSGRKSGLLKLFSEGKESHIYFEEGLITYARVLEGSNLGEYLMRMELLTSAQVQQLVSLQRKENPHTLLGLLAYRRKLIREDQLLDALKAQISDTITEVLSWGDDSKATFSFEELGVEASQVPTEHRFSTQSVLFEAAGRIDEWSRGQVKPWQVLRAINTSQNLELEEWELVSLLNGQRSSASVATEFDIPEGEVYRRLFKLVEKKVAEILPVQPEDPFILVISPSSTLRRLCVLLLTRARYRIVTAANLEKGMETLQNAHVGAALVDTDNPGADAKSLRGLSGRAHLPVIALTKETPSFWARFSKLRYLSKPLEESELLEVLAQVVRRPR